METVSNIACTVCKKDIATDFARCASCRNTFHPRCFRPHKIIGLNGEKSPCIGTAQLINRAGTSSPCPTAPAPTTIETLAQATSQTTASSEPTMSTLLTAIQSCSDALASFRASQVKHNEETAGQLGNLQKDLSGRLDRLSCDLQSVANKVREVEASVGNLKKEVQVVSSKHDEMSVAFNARLSQVEEQQRTFAEVVASHAPLSSDVTDQLRMLTARFAKFEGQRRESELVVSGLPEQPQEDLRALILQISHTLGKPLATADIVRVTRMRGTVNADRPRLVHVLLTSRTTRDALLRAKREKRSLTAKDIDATLDARPVYINEYLPRDTWALLKTVRLEAKKRGYQFVWHYTS